MIRFLFRRSKFPIICAGPDFLFAAETPAKSNNRIGSIKLPPGEQLPVIDATEKSWVLHTDHMVISPLTFKRRWTKKEIIELFNESKTAKGAELEYPLSSLSSKRLNRVFDEIVKLILEANKPQEMGLKNTG